MPTHKDIKPFDMIIAEGHYYSLNDYETKLNNNVIVVGTSGSGKTRSVVTPNLLQANTSYVVTDPKGNLYRKYGNYLKKKGYRVVNLDFVNPRESMHYNPFCYLEDDNDQDFIKTARMLNNEQRNHGYRGDPFWDLTSEMLLSSLIAYLKNYCNEDDWTVRNLMKLLRACEIEEFEDSESTMDVLIKEAEREDFEKGKREESFTVRQYKNVRSCAAKTMKSIVISAMACVGNIDTDAMHEMMAYDELHLERIGYEKTAVFVNVSDTDRSMDNIIQIFFTQAMNVLTREADRNCEDQRLPIPVRFIMDDFATNCSIDEFPKIIASIRSRNISTTIMIQAEGQLRAMYGDDDKTIIGNCDTYIYLGGNDRNTAEEISKRSDVPVRKIMNMEIGTCRVFRRGQAPQEARIFDVDSFLMEKIGRDGKAR